MKKVFVGMSGGVDSSVTATLLKQQGYDVVGVFIKVWEPPNFPCTWKDDRRDAMRVAAKLGLPFQTIDLSKQYEKEVVEYMINNYKHGLTPNPDVMCNKSIKFGGFFDWALSQGANYVATGHYAYTEDGKLYAGLDQSKDQSYFLWTLKSDVLKKTIFPLGNLTKQKVRQLAHDFDLPTANKKESQGLCFIGKINIKDFLKDYIEEKPGLVLDQSNKVIGEHEGSIFYTIGQRHGFKITDKIEAGKPHYVVSKDLKRNTLTVGQSLPIKSNLKVRLVDTNWLETENVVKENQYYARIRHRGELLGCQVDFKRNEVYFKEIIGDLSPGQSLVLYDGRKVIGGGIISQL